MAGRLWLRALREKSFITTLSLCFLRFVFRERLVRLPSSLCHQSREKEMSNGNDGVESNLKKSALNRRNMLLAGTTLAAASALGTAASVQKAVAQAQQAAATPPSGKQP